MRDFEAERYIQRTTNYWVADQRQKPGSKQTDSTPVPTYTGARISKNNVSTVNRTNVMRWHQEDEMDTAKNNFRLMVNTFSHTDCNTEIKLELAQKTLQEIKEQAKNPHPVLTVDLLNEIISNYAHNPSQIKKDPDLSKLGGFVVALGIYDHSIFDTHYSKRHRGEPSKLAQGIEIALEKIDEDMPGVKKLLLGL